MGSNGQMGITVYVMSWRRVQCSVDVCVRASEKQSPGLADSSLANSSVLNYRGEQWG
jgi:hypothetical protein